MGHLFASVPGAYYEWHQIIKVGNAYVLSMEVGPSAGKRWRPALAVSTQPASGWKALDVDLLLQTQWTGLYRDDAIYHVATPAFYPFNGRWLLFAQACARPSSDNYIDGHWELWCIECERRIPLLPDGPALFIPGHSSK